jgi:HK97 family phage major capsid protein
MRLVLAPARDSFPVPRPRRSQASHLPGRKTKGLIKLIPQNIELREERGRIAKEMARLSDDGLKTSEQKEKFERLDAEQKRLKERIEVIERADTAYTETRQTGAPPNGQLGGIVGPTEQADREYRAAFNKYLRVGRNELTMEDRATLRHETRDMGTGGQGAYPGATSGFFVPVGFVREVETAMKYYGPMLNGGRGFPTIIETATGQPLPWPTSNDTSITGELIGEGQQVTTADVIIGMVMFNAWKMSSKLVKVSLELMEDSAFDFQEFLIKQFAERIGRAANQYLTTGLGSASSQPYGIIPATLAGGLTVTALGASSNDGSSAADTIGSDDLTNLEHLIDPLYRPGAKYMFNDSTLKALKKVKDKYGRPLWQTGVSSGAPDTINGYEYCTTPYMDALQVTPSSPTVTRNTVLFGALEKYTVRRVKQLTVLRLSERFADYGQVAFIGFFRFDGQLLDAGTHPLAILQSIY